ncbi:winged helix-turn-helix domain-containing protein [Virgisporangium aurantiacum]|uniref:Transcriptional regulator n=1 Tax=Virgisporangium aurantiacum TaxID=175570 RepID=A0A8J4E538_9ACTN|nr:helix-turn-helix domain-containing protein [Virgisporangium aurantiacum]GIJ61734.1 transcriptional regulator [Virgisporangium aurantiacum]
MAADDETRRTVGTPDELAALAHPLRLDLLNHLMSSGPATASQCARAIGDTPSNCSYHLRYLARHGLVEPALDPASEPEPVEEPKEQKEAQETGQRDNRERPWRATITGFSFGSGPQTKTLAAITLQRDHRLARDYLGRVDHIDEAWREAGGLATYTLRMTSTELAELYQRLDALIRPFIAATRGAVDGAELVHLGLNAFPLERER